MSTGDHKDHLGRSPQEDRETGAPITSDLAERIRYLKSAYRDLDAQARLVDVDETALELGMHDLRRTWATDAYYSLAFAGVSIAEQLTMSWGGWDQT